MYHDVDFALFHNNLQKNVALRVGAWQGASKGAQCGGLPLHEHPYLSQMACRGA